jgi:indolepyruvate ferredoxin oxidoreductase, alpha subunit
MNGREAIAEALLLSTDRQYTVPGFPVTELGEQIGAEMVVNEKTALEYALGDSLSGRRAAVIVKNVGVNACADPLLQATAQGLISGVLLVAGDDPDARGSQTAQDSRYYGELAELPVVEPDGCTCYAGVEAALQASEHFSRVAILRITPPLLDGPADRSVVPREDRKGRISDRSWTMHGRVMAAETLYGSMFDWADASPLNCWREDPAGVGPSPGASRIVIVHPLPRQAAGYRDIHEFGRPFVRDHRGLCPPSPGNRPQSMEDRGYYRTFCTDCPFITVFDILREKQLPFICDAGCSILGMTPPYALGVASYGMGSSIAVAARSTGIALIGDYALLHSGLNALIDVYEKHLPLLSIVLVNRCTAMTGKQPSPDPVPYIGWAAPVICQAEDIPGLTRVIHPVDGPVTVVVPGSCPDGAQHRMIPISKSGGCH